MVPACFLVLKGFRCVASTAELLMKGLPHDRPRTPPLRQIPPPSPACNEPLNKWSWLLTNFIWSSASCSSNRRTARLPHFQDWLFQKPSPSRFHVNEPSALTTKDYPFFLRPLSLVSFFRLVLKQGFHCTEITFLLKKIFFLNCLFEILCLDLLKLPAENLKLDQCICPVSYFITPHRATSGWSDCHKEIHILKLFLFIRKPFLKSNPQKSTCTKI